MVFSKGRYLFLAYMRLFNAENPSEDKNLCSAPPGPGHIPLWKRALDGSCILISLPVTLPALLLVALWIKIVSRGPVFFRQERIGYKGSRFTMFKFRTMKKNVETALHEQHVRELIQADTPMTKLDALADPRIIPGGRILRSLGIDELPPLINVLRGEMSLVGPRPCLPFEWEKLRDWQKERYNAAPGLTGYWQGNGKNKTTFPQMVQMDIYYTKHRSLALDLVIMLKTVPAILAQVSRRKRGTGTVTPLPEINA